MNLGPLLSVEDYIKSLINKENFFIKAFKHKRTSSIYSLSPAIGLYEIQQPFENEPKYINDLSIFNFKENNKIILSEYEIIAIERISDGKLFMINDYVENTCYGSPCPPYQKIKKFLLSKSFFFGYVDLISNEEFWYMFDERYFNLSTKIEVENYYMEYYKKEKLFSYYDIIDFYRRGNFQTTPTRLVLKEAMKEILTNKVREIIEK